MAKQTSEGRQEPGQTEPRKLSKLKRLAIGVLSLTGVAGAATATIGVGVTGYGVFENSAEQGAERSCAEVGYSGYEVAGEDPQFVDDCNEAYRVNHNGIPSDDDKILLSPEDGQGDTHVATGVLLTAGGLVVTAAAFASRGVVRRSGGNSAEWEHGKKPPAS